MSMFQRVLVLLIILPFLHCRRTLNVTLYSLLTSRQLIWMLLSHHRPSGYQMVFLGDMFAARAAWCLSQQKSDRSVWWVRAWYATQWTRDASHAGCCHWAESSCVASPWPMADTQNGFLSHTLNLLWLFPTWLITNTPLQRVVGIMIPRVVILQKVMFLSKPQWNRRPWVSLN